MAATEDSVFTADISADKAPKKKSLLGRLRGRNRKSPTQQKRDVTPPPKAEERDNVDTPATATGSPTASADEEEDSYLVTEKEQQQSRQVRFPAKDTLKSKSAKYKKNVKPPSASEAAFGGPPRYDWIDIETAAAVKVQSIARRNMTMSALEHEGVTTAAIRNRSRRRRARMDRNGSSGSADVPGIFSCCGVGLAFGDATEEEYDSSRVHDRELFLEKKKEKAEHEEQLRNKFTSLEAKKKASRKSNVQEVFEVVE